MVKINEVSIGSSYYRLKVERLYRAKLGKFMRLMAECSCSCGGSWSGLVEKLGIGVKSCGCLHRDSISTHGLSSSDKRLYFIWVDMIRRCTNPRRGAYKNYGGRGIRVCSEWMDAKIFGEWAEASGYKSDLTLDRIDVNGDYNPNNCRWIPLGEQSGNRRNSLVITAWGETKTLAEWRKDIRCLVNNRGLITRRIRKWGWSPEEAMTIPSSGNGKTKSVSLSGG